MIETNSINSSYLFISTVIFHFNNSWFLKLWCISKYNLTIAPYAYLWINFRKTINFLTIKGSHHIGDWVGPTLFHQIIQMYTHLVKIKKFPYSFPSCKTHVAHKGILNGNFGVISLHTSPKRDDIIQTF